MFSFIANEQYKNLFELTIDMPDIVLGQKYRIVAGIDHETNGRNVIANYTNLPFEALSGYLDCPPNCDHCQLSRQRKQTYLVSELGQNGLSQIGSTCVEEYTKTHNWGAYLSYLNVLADVGGVVRGAQSIDPDDELANSDGLGFVDYIDFETALVNTLAIVDAVGGYVSKAKAEDSYPMVQSTSEMVKESFLCPGEFKNIKFEQFAPKAREIIEWCRSGGLDRTGIDQTYAHNLAVFQEEGALRLRYLGQACGLVAIFNNHQRDKLMSGNSEHQGVVGDKLEKPLSLIGTSMFEGQFGTQYIHNLIDSTGNNYIWKTANRSPLYQKTFYMARFSVKAHDEYRGRKQTVITRPNFLDIKLAEKINPDLSERQFANLLKKFHDLNVQCHGVGYTWSIPEAIKRSSSPISFWQQYLDMPEADPNKVHLDEHLLLYLFDGANTDEDFETARQLLQALCEHPSFPDPKALGELFEDAWDDTEKQARVLEVACPYIQPVVPAAACHEVSAQQPLVLADQDLSDISLTEDLDSHKEEQLGFTF